MVNMSGVPIMPNPVPGDKPIKNRMSVSHVLCVLQHFSLILKLPILKGSSQDIDIKREEKQKDI